MTNIDETIVELKWRTDAKLRYADLTLGELKALPALNGEDFDRAHVESFFFHLFGVRDALLAEIAIQFGENPDADWTIGKLWAALKRKGNTSEAVRILHVLDRDESSWYSAAKAMRDHSAHRRGLSRNYRALGATHGQVNLRHPESNIVSDRHLIDDLQTWHSEMTALAARVRVAARRNLP